MTSPSPQHNGHPLNVRSALFVSALLIASPVAAQCPRADPCPAPGAVIPRAVVRTPVETSDQLAVLGVNAAIGGLTGGLRQWRNDGSFRDGFVRGALGGVGVYAGKWIVANEFPAGGVLGRTVAGVGASITRNASEGKPTFHRLILPVGPLRLHWLPSEGTAHLSADMAAIGSLLALRYSSMDVELDGRRSLTSGIPVFLARDWEPEVGWHGRYLAGAIVLRGDRDPGRDWTPGNMPGSVVPGADAYLDMLLAHEQIHMIQYDQVFILWSDPVEMGLMTRAGLPSGFARRVDLSLHLPAFLLLREIIDYHDQPWEKEAYILPGIEWRRPTPSDGGR